MKIDKSNLNHWRLLILFGLNVLAVILLRPFVHRERPGPRQVLLYSHKLSGNLLAIYRRLRSEHGDISPVFLTMDPAYHRQLVAAGEASCLAVSLDCIRLLTRADALISDHGLHVMQPLLSLSNLKFFDVWHGIPFKGFDSDDFRVQHRYDETWVVSPLMAELYTRRFGFDPCKVVVTGYARTDTLVMPEDTTDVFRRRLGLEYTQGHKLVLFAPTWKHEARDRSLFPFGSEARDFLNGLADVCRRHGAMLLFRAHLNVSDPVPLGEDTVIPLPFADYPETESILRICDVLICDWSSIAFDFLLLNRPTLFLDVEPPFRKGFSLGPEYRFGPVVDSLPDLLKELERSLIDPSGYRAKYADRYTIMRDHVYGDYADGSATRRCIDQLNQALAGGFSR